MARNTHKASDIASTKISYTEWQKLPRSEQRRLTSTLVSAVNKRIRRLGESEIGRLSPTYQAFERRGNQFYTIKGLEGDALYNRFQALQDTMNKATSVRGWKKQRQETLNRLNLDGIDAESEKAFWDMFRRYQETGGKYKKFRKEISDKILTYIASTFEKQGYDYTEKTRNKITKWLKEEYEKEKQQRTKSMRERSTSTYVSDEESE